MSANAFENFKFWCLEEIDKPPGVQGQGMRPKGLRQSGVYMYLSCRLQTLFYFAKSAEQDQPVHTRSLILLCSVCCSKINLYERKTLPKHFNQLK